MTHQFPIPGCQPSPPRTDLLFTLRPRPTTVLITLNLRLPLRTKCSGPSISSLGERGRSILSAVSSSRRRCRPSGVFISLGGGGVHVHLLSSAPISDGSLRPISLLLVPSDVAFCLCIVLQSQTMGPKSAARHRSPLTAERVLRFPGRTRTMYVHTGGAAWPAA